MKFTPLLVAAALAMAAGSGMAQTDNRTLGEKTRDGMHKAGDATKRAWNKTKEGARDAKEDVQHKSDDRKDKSADARRDDQRRMGAGRANGDVAYNGDRQSRIDDAYANWKKKN